MSLATSLQSPHQALVEQEETRVRDITLSFSKTAMMVERNSWKPPVHFISTMPTQRRALHEISMLSARLQEKEEAIIQGLREAVCLQHNSLLGQGGLCTRLRKVALNWNAHNIQMEHAKGTHSQGLAPPGICFCWSGTRPGKLHHDQQAQQALRWVFRGHRLNNASLDHAPPWGLRSQTQMLPPSVCLL